MFGGNLPEDVLAEGVKGADTGGREGIGVIMGVRGGGGGGGSVTKTRQTDRQR